MEYYVYRYGGLVKGGQRVGQLFRVLNDKLYNVIEAVLNHPELRAFIGQVKKSGGLQAFDFVIGLEKSELTVYPDKSLIEEASGIFLAPGSFRATKKSMVELILEKTTRCGIYLRRGRQWYLQLEQKNCFKHHKLLPIARTLINALANNNVLAVYKNSPKEALCIYFSENKLTAYDVSGYINWHNVLFSADQYRVSYRAHLFKRPQMDRINSDAFAEAVIKTGGHATKATAKVTPS